MPSAAVSGVQDIHPNKQNFIEGVSLIFESWTAMRLAVQMEFAGQETAEKEVWLQQTIVAYFDKKGKKVEVEELEDILLDVMGREFCVTLEDDSEREIAKMLWSLYRQCIQGTTDMLENLRTLKAKRNASRSGSDVATLCQGVEEADEADYGEAAEEEGEDEDGESECESDVMEE